ncbi:hypothetical protein Tco_0829378 [Tanacetum coccineum]
MDNPDITMEEYIELEAEKARRHCQEFNREIATYGKVRYFKDIDYFKDFENEFPAIFPAIVYNDALATDHKISSEPPVSPLDNNDIDFRISLDESDDEDYICIFDKSSFSYKLIYVNDLKTDSGNDNDKVNIDLPSDKASIKPPDSIINDNVDINSHEFDESFETNHDIHVIMSKPSRDDKEELVQEGNALFEFQDLCLRQELLEYMGVHDNDASESSQPSWGKISKLEYKFQDKENSEDIFSFGSAMEDFMDF